MRAAYLRQPDASKPLSASPLTPSPRTRALLALALALALAPLLPPGKSLWSSGSTGPTSGSVALALEEVEEEELWL